MRDYWNARASEGWVNKILNSASPPGVEDEEGRLTLRAELDALVARDVFGLTAGEMDYILATFPAWREREEKRYGEFRTRRLILDAFETST